MNNVIQFPARARVAANDANPWLDDQSPVEPSTIKRRLVTDPVSGVQYMGLDFDDEPKRGAGGFILGVLIWLFVFALLT